MDEDERQRKLEAGRAKLASYRQKRAKGGGPGPAKKAPKGKSQDVPPQNDRPAQDRHLEYAPASANSHQERGKGKSEADQRPKKEKVKQKIESDSSPSPERSLFPVEDLKDEDLAALTSKEQLKLLQEAVEKRNEIIAKLSANLQEALSSRDQVQLEAQSLTGQIQGLQKQLHQTSMEFSRIKGLHGHSSDSDSSHKDAPLTNCKNVEGSNTESDDETTAIVKKLKLELENEKERSLRILAELQEEKSAVLLLEDERREWREELKRTSTQLQDLQSQCLEMQQYKREKERLNIEVSELRKRLQEEEHFSEEAASSVRSLGEELEVVKKQLEDRERELKFREEEVLGLKASKNRQNQARAGFSSNDSNPGDSGDANTENRSGEDSANASLTGDVLMERYLSSEPPAFSQSSQVDESFQPCDLLDVSGDCSFELNSEVLADHALSSISNRLEEVNESVHDLPTAEPLLQWFNDSQNDKLDVSKSSDHSGDTHLEKDLLYQQCRELHEELAQKDRDVNVLSEEVAKSAEELEEARSRWAQVTEELREALLELEEEREKRLQMESLLKSNDQEELQTSPSALQQEREPAEEDLPVDLLMFSPLQTKEGSGSGTEDRLQTLQSLCDDLESELEASKKELKTATDLLDQRTQDFESSQSELLSVQTRMAELLLELDKSKASLDQAEKEKSDLDSRVVCLTQNVANLEETQAKAVADKEEMAECINKMEQVLEEELEQFENLLKSKEAEVAEEKEKWEEERQEKDKQLSVLRSLLEELKQKSEKEVKELMEKQRQAVEEATEMVRTSYQQQISELKHKHQQESSELKAQLQNQLLEQRATLEEEQKRQINLIKQVTEREHERMMAELTDRHAEELEQQRTEATLELRESMEAAHQVEMQHAQAQKMLELEALRLSLTCAHQSQQELSQDTALGKIQASMTETFAQERALIQAKHQTELEQAAASHNAALHDKEQQVLHLQGKEGELQQEILNLLKEKTLLKQSSQEEVGQLWTQLESMRTSRQELGELKEQLRARSSQVEDIERLKSEFTEQKREIKQQNEAELESLRRYFEQRLHVAEEGYREEIALLQLRMVEGALEESVLKTANDCDFANCPTEEEKEDVEQKEMFDSLRHHLEEKHMMELADLRSSMSESFKEELRQARSDLTDQYYQELQEKKSRQALEMEQLKAKLSESHLRELTRLQLEAARQTEVELEQRTWCLTEELRNSTTIIHALESRLSALSNQHKADVQSTLKLKEDFAAELAHLEDALQKERDDVEERSSSLKAELTQKHESELCVLREEFGRDKAHLEKALEEENNRLRSLQAALDSDNGPQLLKVRQRLEEHFHNELQRTKNSVEEEAKQKLQQAQQRFQEEKAALERHLSQKYELSLADIKEKLEAELAQEKARTLMKHSQELDALIAKHSAQLDALSTSHREQLAAMAAELRGKHNAELVALEAALHSQRKLDLASLEAAFQETSQAQLEAQEAGLERRHQEDRDDLETRMLGNMDTLEATYLKEVQTLRDEMMALEERHCQELMRHKSEREQMIAERRSVQEELRKQLSQGHSAVAAELTQAHKIELSAQKEALDADHCEALESLKKQVLELEHQHSAALQELTSSFAAENGQLTEQHQEQLQELRNISARELEACRRELQEEASRQRQHLNEEVELLKAQSEERLQERVGQLKAEFEEQKEAELEELRRSHASEQEEKEKSYSSKMSQLTAQLQQLDAVVAQLREEVGCLQGELEGKRSEMETLDTLLQRRERESQEGGNLLKMLTDDVQTAKEEKTSLLTANEKLRRVVVDMLRSAIATEDMIGQKISTRDRTSTQAGRRRSSTGNRDAPESVADLSSEDLELTHALCESLLVSDTKLTAEGEEAALSASGRLHRAVATLLELLNHANAQLEESHTLHLSLEQKLSQGRDDSAQFIEQHKLLMEQLNQEAKQKSVLQLELHKTEGLLQGFVAEKAILEESLQQKEAQEERLAEELEGLKVQLHHMQNLSKELDMLRRKNQELSEEHAVLLRQKEHLSADLGEREKALLAEVEHLSRDRLDLQRQAEKDHSSLSQRVRVLERELEEQEAKGLETEQHHLSHTDDLHQRVQALEKQLKHNRHFIEEQAVEREHERDEFQQEIKKLESQLRQAAGTDNKGLKFEDMVFQVENLQALIKDKTEDHATLLAANQKSQRDLAERNEEIDKLAGRIRELEQALLSSAETSRTVNQLEQELHKASLREQELTQDKQALEQLQLTNRLQISALQSKLDETRHRYQQNSHDPTQELRDALDTAQQDLHSKEQEVEGLLVQLETVHRDLSIKEVELKHLALQLELITNQNTAQVNDLQEQIGTLNDNVSALTVLQEQREDHPEDTEADEDTFPSALLLEKNLEIDQLHHEIQRLEQELEHGTESKDLEVEQLRSQVEELRAQVEHLRSETHRIRQDKQEEEERLHEVISTLQTELATLGPNLHEASDSQDSINPSPAPSPEPQHHHHHNHLSVQARPVNLRQELGVSNPASTRNLRSRLKALQSQLETVATEKDGLERLLHRQEEEYRSHGEEFGKRLKLEVEKVEELQRLLNEKTADLEQLQIQLEEQVERLNAAEDQFVRYQTETSKNVKVLREEKGKLHSTVLELESKDKARLEEINVLKVKEQEMELEMGVLRGNGVTLERQIEEARAQLLDMEALVAKERSGVKKLENAKEELTDALRSREEELEQEVDRLKQEVAALSGRVQELTEELREKERSRGEEQKEVLGHAEVARADAVLKEKEAEHQTLRQELNTVKGNLEESAKKAEELHTEGQRKEQALADLENHNQQLRAELQILQDDLAAQEEELALHRRELQTLRQGYQHDGSPQQQTRKDSSRTVFEDVLSSHGELSLSSPEVLRRLDSEDRLPQRLHTSALESRLSELSALNASALELRPPLKPSPRIVMETPDSRTITPEPESRSSHSPQSGSNYSTMDSLDTDKVQELEGLTTPSSPLGSTSSLSAPEWASDGYGSNVSSELGARLRLELEQTERLDAQFVEYLRCRGIDPTANTDSAAGSMSFSEELLSPELQALLRKVYQESCRILTLSQRHHPSALGRPQQQQQQQQQRSVDGSSLRDQSSPPMSWQQEKRALQETVIALRELLCRMAQRHNADGGGQLQDGHMELQLRAELEERQKEVQRAHNVQQEQKNKIQTLRTAVEEGEEALRRERSKIQMLQQELEQERTHSLRKDIEDGERREAEHASSEQHRSEAMALRGQVEQERVACSNLRRELQIEQSRCLLLEKHLQDVRQELEQSVLQQDVSSQEKTRLEHLLNVAESCLAEIQAELDKERSRSSKQLDELNRRHETDAARDRNFISDLRAQLDQERRQSEELASEVDRLRGELLHGRRKWEEQERALREETLQEQEALTRQKVALESLEEQRQEACGTLEAQKSLSRRQEEEITELKERLQLMKSKEREREEQWERERRRGRQEQAEREKRQQSSYSKLCELEALRKQDQQRLQELQRTLAELEREERTMATQRLAGLHGKVQTDAAQHNHQVSSVPSSVHMDESSKENSDLREQLTLLIQERSVLKLKISTLSQQLRRTENELLRTTSQTENRHDPSTHSKLQRLYERYLRAESFRKALVYQKRYLLLLIGGFQQCEKATLCLIASMGARPSPYLSTPLRGYGRFRATVCVVIAISRMKFLTRKWQKNIRRVSLSGSMNGPTSGSKAEVLRQQQPNLELAALRETVAPFVPPSKPSFRLHRRSSSSSTTASVQTGATSVDPEKSLTEYIQHLEKVQHRLAGVRQGSPVLQPSPKKSER